MPHPGEGAGGAVAAPSSRKTVALLAGTTSMLVSASLLGVLLAFLEKVPCRSGAWNTSFGQFQDACYTDIYPLYYSEGLVSGKVPYTGHHVEYPVLTGGMMQTAAWLVRNISDPYTRGREFYDVTVVMLAVCAVAGVLATAYAAGPRRRWSALMVALAPAFVLSAFVNWDLLAMALAALGLAAWAARRGVLAGVLLGLAVAAKFYPLLFFGPLLLLCLRAGRMRDFWVTTGSAALAWLAVNLPVMIIAPSGWATFYQFSRTRAADWGSIWYFFEHLGVPLLGASGLGTLNLMSAAVFAIACVAITVLALAAAAPAPAAAALFPGARGVPDDEQGLVPAVRDLAGAARGAGPAPVVAVCALAAGRDLVLPRHLGLSRLHLPRWRTGPRLQRHQLGLVLRGPAGPVRDRGAAVRLRGARHPASRAGMSSGPRATTTRRAACWTARLTGSCCGWGARAACGRRRAGPAGSFPGQMLP